MVAALEGLLLPWPYFSSHSSRSRLANAFALVPASSSARARERSAALSSSVFALRRSKTRNCQETMQRKIAPVQPSSIWEPRERLK